MKHFFLCLVIILVLLSCATTSGVNREQSQPLLPLKDGWYQYDFTRTFRGIEDEHNYAVNFGMTMVQELTWSYTGVVVSAEGGYLFDPVTGIELFVEPDGRIASRENMSIRGRINNDGTFQWSGLQEEHGRLNSVFVRGSLTPLPLSARGGPEFDGVFHITDSGSGRQQLVRISGGFYTWSFLDDEETGFTPWPTLIRPDGSFSFSMDMATVMEMSGQSQNFSTGFLVEGKVTPGQGITMEEVSRTAGMGIDQEERPQIFAGTMIRSGEFPNEAIPANIESVVSAGRSAVRTLPAANPAQYPAWYLNLPVRGGFLFAAGEKTFDIPEIAFTMAEAAAAANLADQVMMRIISTVEEASANERARIETRLRTEALQRINYRVVEQVFNTETRTAFVLLEMAADQE